jgi:hypothetical protein
MRNMLHSHGQKLHSGSFIYLIGTSILSQLLRHNSLTNIKVRHWEDQLLARGPSINGISGCTTQFLFSRIKRAEHVIEANTNTGDTIFFENHRAMYVPFYAGGTSAISVPLLSSRMFYSRARAYPVAVFSVIKYDAGEEKAKMAKLKAEDQRGLEVFELPQRDWRGKNHLYLNVL